MILIAVGSLSSEHEEQGRIEAAVTRRATDSARVMEVLAHGGTGQDTLDVDQLIHADSFAVAHDTLHRRSVDLLLQAARGSASSPYALENVLGRIRAPLTAAQSRERDRLMASVKGAQRTREAASRQEFAQLYETQLLRRGMDVHVNTTGAGSRHLVIRYVLAGRVMQQELEDDQDFWTAVWGMGFTRVDLEDGYDFHVYWTKP